MQIDAFNELRFPKDQGEVEPPRPLDSEWLVESTGVDLNDDPWSGFSAVTTGMEQKDLEGRLDPKTLRN